MSERIQILVGDSLERVAELPENSVDAVVTDSPYGISMMAKKWDAFVPKQKLWQVVLRVLKPGGHLVSFFGARTYHRGAVAIEDAGFEIRDQLLWLNAQGMPKSVNLGEGRGTGLAPGHEPIVLARKPFPGTLVENLSEWGTAGLNIDACRNERGNWPSHVTHDGSQPVLDLFPETAPKRPMQSNGASCNMRGGTWGMTRVSCELEDEGGSAARYFYCSKASSAERDAGLGGPVVSGAERAGGRKEGSPGLVNPRSGTRAEGRNDHISVKPLSLMRWLCRLVTPPGGTVLDPFMGSGSTGVAAHLEGFAFIGCEIDPHHASTAELRIRHYAGEGRIESEAPRDEVEARAPAKVGFFS